MQTEEIIVKTVDVPPHSEYNTTDTYYRIVYKKVRERYTTPRGVLVDHWVDQPVVYELSDDDLLQHN